MPTILNFQYIYEPVAPSRAVKYLGVWLDSKLTFAEHDNRAVQKAEKINFNKSYAQYGRSKGVEEAYATRRFCKAH